jgi:hypothetical protein
MLIFGLKSRHFCWIARFSLAGFCMRQIFILICQEAARQCGRLGLWDALYSCNGDSSELCNQFRNRSVRFETGRD